MSKHTPGPWHMQANRLDRTGDLEFGVFSGVVEEAQFPSMLKWIIGGKGERSSLSEEDARLIAAAPELLAAAKFALKCLDAANEAMGGWASTEYYVDCRNDLKKAIAKVEGKTK